MAARHVFIKYGPIVGVFFFGEKDSYFAVEQNALAALEIVNYCYVMENERIVMDGPVKK